MPRMLRCLLPGILCMMVLPIAASQEGKKYSITTANNPFPKELSEPIKKLLNASSIQMLDQAGQPICEVWNRNEIPADAAPEQIKTGITYREVKQTEILGAIQFHRDWSDYRKQKIKSGVYLMRLAFQPTDGKHTADVADFQDFALLTSAKSDTKSSLMDPKALYEASGDSIGSGHPGVFMLWPNTKPGKLPTLEARPKNHWVLNMRSNLSVGGKTAEGGSFGIGLTLVGHSPAE